MRPFFLLPLAVVTFATFAAPPARADVKAECLDAASKGQALRDAHALLEARAAFRVCAREACPSIVQSDCGGWLEATTRALPTVVFDAKDASGADLGAVRVSIDGRPLTDRLDGTALPVNPGDHDFTFEAPGQVPMTRHLVVKEGEKDRLERLVFHPSGLDGGLETRKVLGLAVGVAGIVLGGVGAYLNLNGKSRWEGATSRCTNGLCAPGDADTARGAATEGTVGMLALGTGVLAVAGGVVLWITAPHPAITGSLAPSASVAVAPNGLLFRGTF